MCETTGILKQRLNSHEHLILAALIGFVVGIISIYILHFHGGMDFMHMVTTTRNWISGEDIYLPLRYNYAPDAVIYPFSAYLVFIPLAWMPNAIGIGIFMGLACGVLAWLIFRSSNNWYLILFLSWPFAYNVIVSQFAPYAICIFFSASFLPMILIKPQLALPFTLIKRPNRFGLILTFLLLIVSLIIYPSWPFESLKSLHIQNYSGFQPLFLLPFGPLIVLALIRYREKRAWLLVLMALMPQRVVYDQLGVLLVAGNRKQLIFLVLCSWITLPAVVIYEGWGNLPFGWTQWILFSSYLPALLVLLWPVILGIYSKITIRYKQRKNRIIPGD
jgi:hypothetical protein